MFKNEEAFVCKDNIGISSLTAWSFHYSVETRNSYCLTVWIVWKADSSELSIYSLS